MVPKSLKVMDAHSSYGCMDSSPMWMVPRCSFMYAKDTKDFDADELEGGGDSDFVSGKVSSKF